MFQFLLYIQPAWKYRLVHKAAAPVLVDYSRLEQREQVLLEWDENYPSALASKMDAAYQALTRGFFPNGQNAIVPKDIVIITDVASNYRFVRKYFALHWYVYVFLIRLLTLNAPLRECRYFLMNLRVKKRNSFFKSEQLYQDFFSFESALLKEAPLVSIIIPTLNRYPYLKDALSDLEQQTYRHFEVIIADQSEPVQEKFYEGWKFPVHLIKQDEKALWLARNQCIRQAKGNYLLLYDDDSRVNPDWIEQHMRCLDYFHSSISAGVTHTVVGHGLSSKEGYFHLSDTFDTGNAMVKREVFEKIGLFDRQFEKQRMGDGEFGLRAFLAGFIAVSNPCAKRVHLKVETGGLRQMGSWDALRPKKLFSPRPIPSVLYLIRKYFGNIAARYYLIQNIPVSLIPYQFKKLRSLKWLTWLLTPVIFPVILVSIFRAWNLANQKLKAGSKIEWL